MSELNFFTPVKYGGNTHSFNDSVLEKIDNYFYLGGKKAHVLGRKGEKEEVVLRDTKSSRLARIGKVISYFTIVIPVLMLLAKAILRSTHRYTVIDPDSVDKNTITKIQRITSKISDGEDVKIDIDAFEEENKLSKEPDKNSYQFLFPELPKNFVKKLDKLKRDNDKSAEIELALGRILILNCSNETKIAVTNKILSEFDHSERIKKFAEAILNPVEASKIDPTMHTKQILLQMETLINTLAEGWVKERLKQTVAKYQTEDLVYNMFAYESYLDGIEKFGSLSDDKVSTFNEYIDKLKELKEKHLSQIFSLAISECYNSFDVSGMKIIVCGEVSTDGLGDYYQMWMTAKNLKEVMPETSVAVTLDFKSPPQVSKSCEIVDNLMFSSKEEYESKEIEKKLMTVDCLISIPHGHPANPGNKPVIRVEEYGFNPGGNYALGLTRELDLKTLGIPLTQVSPAKSLEELTHSSLRTLLLDKMRPFFVGYLKKDQRNNEQHRCGFVLAASASHANRKEDIDIVCPFESLDQLDKEVLKNLGIGRVVLMGCDEKKELREKQVIDLQPNGKEIRIFNPFPILNDDWMLLLKFCEPLAGCTGDVSFSEVISNKKIPFYPPRWHKGEFVKQLRLLSGLEHLSQFSQFLDTVKECLVENSEVANFSEHCLKLGALCTSDFEVECRKMTDSIKKYSCTNDLLASRVKRNLAYAKHPELKQIEEEALEKWSSGEINLLEAYNRVQEALRNMPNL